MARGRMDMPPGPGRPKGAANKSTVNARRAIAEFVDGNAEKLGKWLDEIYEKDGPKSAFMCFADLLEYHVPKLTRTELQPLDKDGNKSDGITKIIIERVAADGHAK